jgi:hypothetical protein
MRTVLITIFSFLTIISTAQDSLISKKFSFGGYTQEFGIGGTQISDNRAMLFNITSNCVTGTCQHGLGMALISDNGQLIKSAAFGHAVNDFDVVEAYKSADGNCMALGNSTNNIVILQKMDTNLNILWNKTIPIDTGIGQSGIYLYAAAEIDNHNQVLYGNQWYTISKTGTTIRSKRYLNGYAASNKFDLSAIQKLTTNRYAIGGHICDVSGFDSDPMVMLVDSLGNKLKSKKFMMPNSPYTDQISAIYIKSDNEILAFGNKYNDFFMMSMDSNLNLNWTKTYTSTNFSAYTNQVTKVNSNCYVIVGSGVVFALNAQGTTLWAKTIDFGLKPNVYATDTCHFATYSTKTINNWGSGYWNKMDAQGVGAANISANITLTATSVNLTSATPNIVDKGSSVMMSTSIPFSVVATVQATDSAIIKMPSTSNCGSKPNEILESIAAQNIFNVFPNPTTQFITFEITNNNQTNIEIEIADICGKKINSYNSTNSTLQINLSNMPNGIYFYQVKMNKQSIQNGKFLKQ